MAKRVAIIRTTPDGRVVAQNQAANEWLGPGIGTECHRNVAAQGRSGEPICLAGCARQLLHGAARTTQPRACVIRGIRGSLACHAVGDEVVVVAEVPSNPDDVVGRITPRERAVLALVAEGLSSRQIAERLRIRLSTVLSHVEHARNRLGARSRAEAVAKALANGQL